MCRRWNFPLHTITSDLCTHIIGGFFWCWNFPLHTITSDLYTHIIGGFFWCWNFPHTVRWDVYSYISYRKYRPGSYPHTGTWDVYSWILVVTYQNYRSPLQERKEGVLACTPWFSGGWRVWNCSYKVRSLPVQERKEFGQVHLNFLVAVRSLKLNT